MKMTKEQEVEFFLIVRHIEVFLYRLAVAANNIDEYNRYHLSFLIDGEKVEIMFLKDGDLEPAWSISPSWSSYKYLITTQEKMRLFALLQHYFSSNNEQE